jgi:hypothetical protein
MPDSWIGFFLDEDVGNQEAGNNVKKLDGNPPVHKNRAIGMGENDGYGKYCSQ